jgi:hypothetical protein
MPNFTPNLSGYSLPAAMRLAFALSGRADDDIAAAMGWSRTVAARIFSNLDYWPSLPSIPKLCTVLGNTIIPRWIIANSYCAPERSVPLDARGLFSALRQMMREMAELLESGEAALNDGQIESLEARRVIHDLTDIFHAGAVMLSGLQAVLDREKQ